MAEFHVPGEYTYDGMIMPAIFPKEILDRVPHVDYREDDVLIATYPKAGTTWLSQIVWLMLNNADVETSKKVQLRERSPIIEMTARGIVAMDEIPKLPSPRCMKTHLPYGFFNDAIENPERPNFKIIVGMRNVRDVLVSFYNFYRMNSTLGSFDQGFDAFFQMFKDQRLIYGDYFKHVLGWWKLKGNPNAYFVKYEDLKRDPRGEFIKMANFLGKNLTEEQLDVILKETSFQSMQNDPMTNSAKSAIYDMSKSKFIRKGEVGDWQNYFTEEQVKFVNDLCEKEFGPIGLDFDYTL